MFFFQRKAILLYLHKRNDELSTIFWRNVQRPEVSTILSKHFCVIGWDLSEKANHSGLIRNLSSCQLTLISPYIERNLSAVFILITSRFDDKEIVSVLTCMRMSTSDSDFLNCLKIAATFQIKPEIILNDESTISKVINSRMIQQSFANMLGNRDYDSYEFDQHEYLKKNIAYAICGPPLHEEGYSEKVYKEVERLFKKILEKNSKFSFKSYIVGYKKILNITLVCLTGNFRMYL